MRILIVEDESIAARRLERLVREILGGTAASISHAPSPTEASALLEKISYDLVLLDLHLSNSDGFDLLRTAVASPAQTIVVSGSTERAIEAFEFGVVDFVPKPVEKSRLERAFARISRPAASGETAADVLVVKEYGRLRFVKLADVAFLKGGGDYAEIHCRDGAVLLHSKTLESLETILPPNWLRVHRSYIVDQSEIASMAVHGGGRYECLLKNGATVPVGRSRYREIVEKLGSS